MFAWYWLADLCEREGIPFVLGHALAMKAIHGGKAKNDRLDAHKIAGLLRAASSRWPTSTQGKRETRDLLRRRLFFVRQRGQLIAHIQNTNSQYNLPPFEKRIDRAVNRGELIEHFEEDSVQMSIATDMALLDVYDHTLHELGALPHPPDP